MKHKHVRMERQSKVRHAFFLPGRQTVRFQDHEQDNNPKTKVPENRDFCRKIMQLCLPVAGAGHGTAAAAASAGGFPLLSVFPELVSRPYNQQSQHQGNQNGSGVIGDKLKHILTLSASALWLPDICG